MGQVNTVRPQMQGTASARGGADDITLIAQSNNPTAAGNTDLGKGVVQGVGPDGKTVYEAKLVMRVYDGSGKTRYYANGKALPANITSEEAARTFVRQQIGKGTIGELPRGKQNSSAQAAQTTLTPNASATKDRPKENGTNERFITTKEGTRLRLVDFSSGVQVSAPFVKTRMLAPGTSNEAISQSDYFKATNSKTASPLTLNGTRFEIKRQSGGAQNFVTQIQMADGSTRTVTAGSVKQLKGKLEQALKGNTDALSPSKPPTATRGQKVDYGGFKAMAEILKLPAEGLAAIGIKGPKEQLKNAQWDLENQGRQLGIREDSASVRAGGLLVNAPFAFAGGGAAAATKLPAATKAILTFGVMPAANRVGKDSFNGQLGKNTLTGVGTDIATGVVTAKLGGSSIIRQAATSTVVQTGVKAASGNKVGAYDVFESAVLNTAGAAGSTTKIGATSRSPQRSELAPSGSPIRTSKALKGETTQSSSPPQSLRPAKQETTQHSQMPAEFKPKKLPKVQQSQPPNLTPLPDPSKVLATSETQKSAAPEAQRALPEGAIATFQSDTKHGPLTTEVYRSASMPETKIRANIDLLQQKNPLLYAGLPHEELVSTARKSDVFLVTTLNGTSNLWGRNAPSSTTPERAITAITERNLKAGQYGNARGGRYAELTFVASNSALRGAGGQVVKQAESWARSRGLDGVAFYNTDTTNGASRGFYEHMGYTLTRETPVQVKSLDTRVQQQLIDAGRFTREAVASGEATLPRYYFEKRFDPPTTSAGDRTPPPDAGPTAPSGQTPTPSPSARLDQQLRSVNSVETLLNTPAQPSGGNFRVDNLTRGEIAALGTALSTARGRTGLLNPSPNAPLQTRFLQQSLAEQANPSLVNAQARQRDQAALAEIADNPRAGEPASVKVGYRYVQDQPGGRVHREAVYTQIGQQLAARPSAQPEPAPFKATTKQQALLYGDTVLREFNNALKRPMAPNEAQDAAQIQVLQNPDGSSGQVVQTNRAGLAERFTNLLDAAGPKVQGFNRVLNVVNPVVLAVGAGKTLFDFTQGRVVPRVNDAQAAKLFNLPKGMFVASVTLRSNVAGVPTTYTAYVALGASRDVALLPGQQGGLPRAQIGTNPFTGRRTIGLLSTFNRSAVEVGAGGNVGNNNLAVMSTNSIRLGSIAGNPLRGQINLPDAPTATPGATPNSTLSASGGTALSAQGVQASSLTGLRLGPAVYGRRVVVPIRYVAQASTEAQTTGVGRNFSFGGFSVARLDAKSDAFVITVNPAFDANQIQQLVDSTKKAGNPAQLEGVLQQLERLGAILRGPAR
jgi:hypothetical protein